MRLSRQVVDRIRLGMYVPFFARDIIFCFIKLGYWSSSWRFKGLPLIQKHKNAKIIIGERLSACSDPRFNSIGVFQKVTLKALSPSSELVIGNNVGMSGVTISCSVKVTIGNNVLIGSGALITDSDAHAINPFKRDDRNYIISRPVIIEDDVFIGARSIILKGVTIGKGSVIGAGSVVVKDVLPYSIVAGNPGKVVGRSDDPKYNILKNYE